MNDLPTITEKEIKERINNGDHFLLHLTWNGELQAFYLTAVTAGKKKTSCQILTARKSGLRFFKDAGIAVTWANEIGFDGVRFDPIDF